MFITPIYYIIFSDGRRKLCFSRAHFIRVLQYEGWSREEARQAIEMYADVHPGRWASVSPKRASCMRILACSSTVGSLTFKRLKSFWKNRSTELGTLEPHLPVLRMYDPASLSASIPWRSL
jgi:hypothetical protein